MTRQKRIRLTCHHPAFPHPVEMPRASGCGYGRCRRSGWRNPDKPSKINPLWRAPYGDCKYLCERLTSEEGLRRLGKVIAAAARRKIPEFRVKSVVERLPLGGLWIATSAVAKRAGLTRSNAYYWLYVAVDRGMVETELDDKGYRRMWRRRNA